MDDLPRRRPAGRPLAAPWLPALGELVADEELAYRLGRAGPKGAAWLRAWEAGDDGRFAVLSWIEGLTVTDMARSLRGMLSERFGEPFSLAELSRASVDIVLPPVPGQDQGWLRLYPAEKDSAFRPGLEAWWAVYGDMILST